MPPPIRRASRITFSVRWELDSTRPETALVTVQGPLEYSDIEEFKTKTSLTSKAIVMFGSDGGNLAAGIEIGTTIRLKGFFPSCLTASGAHPRALSRG